MKVQKFMPVSLILSETRACCVTLCRARSRPARMTRPPVLLTAVYSVLILLVYISLVYNSLVYISLVYISPLFLYLPCLYLPCLYLSLVYISPLFISPLLISPLLISPRTLGLSLFYTLSSHPHTQQATPPHQARSFS